LVDSGLVEVLPNTVTRQSVQIFNGATEMRDWKMEHKKMQRWKKWDWTIKEN